MWPTKYTIERAAKGAVTSHIRFLSMTDHRPSVLWVEVRNKLFTLDPVVKREYEIIKEMKKDVE